jgi:hypothetical protein
MTNSLGFMGKLSKPEKQGDLGFSDLHSFNLAMQARQARSTLQNTSSLSVKVLLAKNYQGNSTLQPTPGNGISYTWHSNIKMGFSCSLGSTKYYHEGHNKKGGTT